MVINHLLKVTAIAHVRTQAQTSTWHQRGMPEKQHLCFGLCTHERARSQVVGDIKTGEEEQEDQNYQSSKAGGAKPQCVPLFLPLSLSLSSDAT